MILLDLLAYRLFEGVQMDRARLVHEFADTSLTHLKGLKCISF